MSARRPGPVALGLTALGLAALAFGVGGSRLLDGVAERRASESLHALERAVAHGLDRHRALQLELAEVARLLARSPLTTRLGLVLDAEEQLGVLAARIRRAVPGPPDDPAVVKLRRARIALDEDVVPAFASLWAARLGPPVAAEPAIADPAAEARAFVAACLSIDFETCLHHAALEPLAELVATRGGALGVEVALVVDARGIGLADARDPSWTGVGGLTGVLPALAEALTSRAIVRDVGQVPGRDGLSLLVAAPLVEGEALRGAALVGVALGGHRLAADARAVGHDLSWLVAGTLGASASTLPLADQPELDGERFITARAAVPGNVSSTPILVASMRKELVEAALGDARRGVWLLALGSALLLGLALLALVGRR
ncbi:MAG: hypothetical protein IT385_11515 [Deltaproteobacteria bacterium]|nr:hypothetical protein [Deltaproteobacteria bacterium]